MPRRQNPRRDGMRRPVSAGSDILPDEGTSVQKKETSHEKEYQQNKEDAEAESSPEAARASSEAACPSTEAACPGAEEGRDSSNWKETARELGQAASDDRSGFGGSKEQILRV